MDDLQRKCKRILITVYVLGFTASFAFWIQKGVLPYLTRKLGVTPSVYGYMESTFAFYQMTTSPLFGLLADRYGIRTCFTISECASAVAYATLGFADSIPVLFLSRVPALFMHSLQSKYTIITDITSGDERAKILGRLGVANGLGMISGSFIGGIIAEAFSERTAAFFAGFCGLLSSLIVVTFIPSNTKEIQRQLMNQNKIKFQKSSINVDRDLGDMLMESPTFEDTKIHENEARSAKSTYLPFSDSETKNFTEDTKTCSNLRENETKSAETKYSPNENESASEDTNILDEMTVKNKRKSSRTRRSQDSPNSKSGDENTAANQTKIKLFSFEALWTTLCIPNMKILLLLKLATAFPFGILYSMFSVAIMDFYGLGPRTNGYLLTYVGVMTIIVQGLLIGWITKRFKDSMAVKISILLNLVGYLYLSAANTVYLLIPVLIPLLIGGTVSHILIMVVITKVTPIKDTGSALGIVFALHSIVRAVAPTLGGLMFSYIGWPFIGVNGYVIHFALLTYVIFYVRNEQIDY